MTDSSLELGAVEQLLSEGDALRGWLTRLAQAPSGVPDAVRERVRGDYQVRLDQITAGLRAHADVVSAKLDDDRREHADLLARATVAREGLAEAELRYAVGEYDPDRHQEEQRRFSSDIESFDVALGAAAERIARLEEVHSLVQGAPRPVITDFESNAPAEPEIAAVREITIGELAPDGTATLGVFDVTDVTADSAPAANAGSGPLSFRPSGTTGEWPRPVSAPAARSRPFESAPPLGIPAADVPPRFIRPGERLAPPAPPATITPVVPPSHDAPVLGAAEETAPARSAPEAAGAPAGRTLRCGECGAMNRPLEWYCEKCGAELTAV